MFLMVQTSDHVTGLTGATVTVNIAKNGGVFGAAAGSVAEIGAGGTGPAGWYKVTLTTADTDTVGDLAFHCTATSADPTDFKCQVVTDLPGTAQTGDSYAIINGASGSVATKTAVDGIKTKTDFLPSVTAGGAGGVFIAGTNAATTVTTALTTTFTGDLTGKVGSLDTQAKADVNAEVVDCLGTDAISELSQGAPAATPSIKAALMLLYMALRNAETTTASSFTISNDAGTVICKATLSDDATTFTKAELVSGP